MNDSQLPPAPARRTWRDRLSRRLPSGRRAVAAAAPRPQPTAQAEPQLRTAFMAMQRQAPEVMAGLGVKQWAPAERDEYLALLDYTKE